MKEIMKLGAMLLMICVVAASLLALTNDFTKDKIMEQRALANELARKEVMPEADAFEAVEGEAIAAVIASNRTVHEMYVAKKESQIIGFVVKALPNGYGGGMEVITGLSVEDQLVGVRVGNHQETPGLGGNAQLPSFYDQYAGMSATQKIGVSKTSQTETEIQAISGATITSQAVTDGVNAAIKAVAEIELD